VLAGPQDDVDSERSSDPGKHLEANTFGQAILYL